MPFLDASGGEPTQPLSGKCYPSTRYDARSAAQSAGHHDIGAVSPAMIRHGPRPLPLHLLLATASSVAELTRHWADAWRQSTAGARVRDPAARETSQSDQAGNALTDPVAKSVILRREIEQRAERFLEGVRRYRQSSHRRDVSDPPVIWSEGSSRIHDHGVAVSPRRSLVPPQRTVLFVPSMINRSRILDLTSENSLMRHLTARGIRALRLDWGRPGHREQGQTLDEAIAGRLERAAALAARQARRPVPVVGYCMGGTMVAALACRRPDLVSRAAFLATPWDFHADGMDTALSIARQFRGLAGSLDRDHPLSVDMQLALFTTLDPLVALRKFNRFATMRADDPRARAFVALEDWLNDGVDLPGPIARACFDTWYLSNAPGRGNWSVKDVIIDPGRIACPTLHLIAERDRLVPPASAEALAKSTPGAVSHHVPFGHIGMIVGRSAPEAVWPLLVDWLNDAHP